MKSNPSSLIYFLDQIIPRTLSVVQMHPSLPFNTVKQLHNEPIYIIDDYFQWLGCIDLTKLDQEEGQYLYYFIGTTLCKDIARCDFSEIRPQLLKYREKYKYLFVIATHRVDQSFNQRIHLVTFRPQLMGIGYATNEEGLDERGVQKMRKIFHWTDKTHRKNILVHNRGIVSSEYSEVSISA